MSCELKSFDLKPVSRPVQVVRLATGYFLCVAIGVIVQPLNAVAQAYKRHTGVSIKRNSDD